MTNMGLDIINPLKYPHWDDLLDSQREYSFFHSSAWARVLSESYQYAPRYFCRIERGDVSVLVPVMDVRSVLTGARGVALPFTDYCEPVWQQGHVHEMLNELIRYAKKTGWTSLEIRPANRFGDGLPIASSYLLHTLNLTPGPDQVFKGLHETNRRNIKKAMREGVRVRFSSSRDSVASFYQLNCRTRREHGLPPQPLRFFKKIHEHVLSKNLGFIAIGSHNGRDVAGAVYLRSRKKLIYKYGASLREYQQLRANNLVMWEAIRKGAEQGHQTLCFGRTDLDHAGLRKFKQGWGGEEQLMHYYKYDVKKACFVKCTSWTRGIHTAVYRRMPMSVLKVMGTVLYRHVG